MVDYNKLLRESNEKRWETIQEAKEYKYNPYHCNYCPKNKHTYCTHSHCVFSDEFREYNKKRSNLENELKEKELDLKYALDNELETVEILKDMKNIREELTELKDFGRFGER